MELRLNKQGRACRDLVERQAEVMKACEQAKSVGEKANLALKKLASEHESLKREDGGSLASLDERASSLEKMVAAVDQEVQKHTERAKATEREVQHLKTWTGPLQDIDQLHEKHSKAFALLETHAHRMEIMETDIAQMSKESITQRQLQNTELS